MAAEQESIREMTQRKQNMLLELKNYEENAKLASSAGPGLLLQASKGNIHNLRNIKCINFFCPYFGRGTNYFFARRRDVF